MHAIVFWIKLHSVCWHLIRRRTLTFTMNGRTALSVVCSGCMVTWSCDSKWCCLTAGRSAGVLLCGVCIFSSWVFWLHHNPKTYIRLVGDSVAAGVSGCLYVFTLGQSGNLFRVYPATLPVTPVRIVDGSVYIQFSSVCFIMAFLSFRVELTGCEILAQRTDTYQWN